MEKDEELSIKIIVACALAMLVLMVVGMIFFPN
jgi:hypothetical protein